MLEAIIHGKLSREQENMEDVLTSNVFGMLKYLKPEEGLFPFLAEARTENGSKPLEYLRNAKDADVKYEFWPQWKEADCIFCEPDVVLTINNADGKNLLVLIEAKLWSGKSSEADDWNKNAKFLQVSTFAYPLDEVSSTDELRDKIIDPLLKEMKNKT